ncbi:MAG: tRNA lysidine(34) synthetase TilS [Cytophagales bacterium]|nr:tRNA lysidine(34) synthetase TilS [Cytophagales bacterium]
MVSLFEKKLLTFITENKLFTPNDKLLIGISGGIDSVTMSEALYRLGYNIGLAHVNYRLRANESDQDEAFVRHYAASRHLPLWVRTFDTATIANTTKQGIQQTARQLRYEWFAALQQQHGFTRLLTAHHAGDALETSLYQLAKGGGIKALRGIPLQQGILVRPFLAFDRAEIEAYAQALNLQWREDSSNTNTGYARNFIRHRIVPLVQKINPSVASHFVYTHQRLSDAITWLEKALADAEQLCVRENNGIFYLSIQALETLPSPRFFLGEYLKKFHFNYLTATIIAQSFHCQSGKRFFSATHCLTVNRDQLIITPLADITDDTAVRIDHFGTYLLDNHTSITIRLIPPAEVHTGSRYRVRINPEVLQFPLQVRTWQPGDAMQPFGMKGRKKISDLLTDMKVAQPEKATARVLCNANGQILWLIGYRLAEPCRTANNASSMAEIEILFSQS